MSIDQHVTVCRTCRAVSTTVDGTCRRCSAGETEVGPRRRGVILASGAFVGIAAAMVVAAVTDSSLAAAVVVGASVLMAMAAALTSD